MEIKTSSIKHFPKTKRSTTCDYCDFNQVKPDQRSKQINGWAKIKIKRKITCLDIWKSSKINYPETDMCPDCIRRRL